MSATTPLKKKFSGSHVNEPALQTSFDCVHLNRLLSNYNVSRATKDSLGGQLTRKLSDSPENNFAQASQLRFQKGHRRENSLKSKHTYALPFSSQLNVLNTSLLQTKPTTEHTLMKRTEEMHLAHDICVQKNSCKEQRLLVSDSSLHEAHFMN